MKISVIIPVFNGEKYVAQCLENILHQTYKNLEIIVIDDGSTDNSATIAEQYPVQVIRQENQGPSVSRNKGIEAATGEYIHFMDVDDWINLDYYTHMAEAVTLTNADIACSEMINERTPYETLLFSNRWLLVTTDDKFQVTNAHTQGYVWRYIFRKSFLNEKELRFKTELRFVEDLPFSLQAIYDANKIVTVPHAAYYYKNRENSAMTTMNCTTGHKRNADHKIADTFKKEFEKAHNINVVNTSLKKFQYKILGIPIVKKIVYNNGKTRWYFFGLCLLRRKYVCA
jgi:glycosyltransferase involved in cell wall biosynthesis